VPWAHRYLDELTSLSGGLLSVLSQVRIMRPRTCDEEWLARAEELTRSDDLVPVVRTSLVATVDQLTRVLGARS
jgi:hypothetical protein